MSGQVDPGLRREDKYFLRVEAVAPGDVAAGDLEDVLGRRVLEVAGDDLLRLRPRRGLVRVVRRPHHPVDADELAALHPDMIKDVGGPHLPREILARLQFYPQAGRALREPVPALEEIGDPADIVPPRDDLPVGGAVEDAGEGED